MSSVTNFVDVLAFIIFPFTATPIYVVAEGNQPRHLKRSISWESTESNSILLCVST